MTQKRLASPGSFCWNEKCPDYGKVDHGNIRRYGKTKKGIQRYQCKSCKATFTETKGTIFYGCRTPQEKIFVCFAMLAEGNSLASIRRVTGFKDDTVLAWSRKTANHMEEIEELLLANYQLSCVQLDALWTFVLHKGEKGGAVKRRSEEASGVAVE